MDMRRKKSKDLLAQAKKRAQIMMDADGDNRRASMEDIKFVNIPGAQWDDNMKQERGTRPCYEFNKTRVRCKRVVNDMRDNRPSGKVRPVEGGDKEIAEIYEGLIRNIWNSSHGDNATDYAAEYQVEGGMGAWRVITKYSSDTAFEQDIALEALENPYCLFADPSAKDFMKRDAEDWLLTERITHKAFEDKYGNAEKADFESDNEFDDDDEWQDEQTVRIAEYWYKVPHMKTLWLLDDGKVVDSETDEAAALAKAGFKPVRTREVQTHKIMMCVLSGQKILEGPTEWAGRFFPFVMVYGEYKVIDGKKYWWGLPRFAKDAQRSYNINRTAAAEAVAGAPKEFFWATAKQAEGLTDQWAEAHKKNLPFKLYNSDPSANGPPTRVGGADVPVALIQQAGIDNEDIKDVMGLPDASMGNEGGEKSGRAIYARQQQGEIATFNYKDNMAKAVEWTYEILIDLIPNIYDTERELRILGNDGAEDYAKVNQVVMDHATGKSIRVNDLSVGRYDVTVTVGPSFSTQRQEAAEMYMQLSQGNEQIMGVAGDLVFKSLDLPYADDIAERLRAMLPPQIQSVINDETDLPPEVQQAMMQAEQAMQQVQEHGRLVQAAQAELEQEKSEADQAKAEIRTEIANLKANKAEFDAHIAEQMASLIEARANLTEKAAGITQRDAVVTVKESAQSDSKQAQQAIKSIDEVLAAFMERVDETARGFAEQYQRLSQADQQLAQAVTRQPVSGSINRDGGRITANVQYDDGTTRSVAAVRDKGNLRIVPNSGDSEA